MAAILGYLADSLHESRITENAWNAAVSRMPSRSGPCQQVFSDGGLSVCYRGRTLEGYHQDSSYVVLVDGFPDNLSSVVQQLAALLPGEKLPPAALLARLIKRRGIGAMDRLTGEFAIAVIDIDARSVYLMSDRFATKPLYYVRLAGAWCWASEIKFLLSILGNRELDTEALPEVFHFRWLAGERSLLKGVRQVLPSHAVQLHAGDEPGRRRYSYFRIQPSPEKGEFAAWQDRLDRALDEYFGRMAARHEKVGVLLSGGVDSSLLAAKAVRAGFRKCVALTGQVLGFANPELPNARRVAKHLGMEHRIIEVTDRFIERFFPHFIWRMEFPPRATGGLVIQKLLSSVAPDVDAIVFGEGSDSMFGTKEMLRLVKYDRKQAILGPIPGSLRRAAARLLPDRTDTPWHRVRTLLLQSTHALFLAIDAVDYSTQPADILPGLPNRPSLNEDVLAAFDDPTLGWAERYQAVTIMTDCRCRITMLDRLCDPHGLALLIPFFAPEITSISSVLPAALRFRGEESKPLVREIACKYLPREWIYGRKYGFPTPLSEWLAGPLMRWRKMLKDDRTAQRGLFCMDKVGRLQPERDPEMLWTVLCLETFLREFVDGEGELPAL